MDSTITGYSLVLASTDSNIKGCSPHHSIWGFILNSLLNVEISFNLPKIFMGYQNNTSHGKRNEDLVESWALEKWIQSDKW